MRSDLPSEGGGACYIGEDYCPLPTSAITQSGQSFWCNAPLCHGSAVTPGLASLCSDVNANNIPVVDAHEILEKIPRRGSDAAIVRWLSIDDYVLEGPNAEDPDRGPGVLANALVTRVRGTLTGMVTFSS